MLLVISQPKAVQVQSPARHAQNNTQWQSDYTLARLEAGISNVEDTEYYNINSPTITTIATNIASRTNNAHDATQATLDYVYENVRYTFNEADKVCIDSTATQILERGTGQCDTQSMLVIAILRSMGIAARPVGGCIATSDTCERSIEALQSIGVDARKPKFKTLIPEAITTEQLTYSREQISRKGGLHAWVEAWINGRWYTLESTTGKFADTSCYDYITELIPTDNDKLHFCVSTDYTFAKNCATL